MANKPTELIPSNIAIKAGEEAFPLVGMPEKVIRTLEKQSAFQIISIRGKAIPEEEEKAIEPPEAPPYNQRFGAKPTATHQKTTVGGPANGHIVERDEYSRAGLDPTDHPFGALPEGCTTLDEGDIKEMGYDFGAHSRLVPGSEIVQGSISSIDGRICYKTKAPRFEKVKQNEIPVDTKVIEFGSPEYQQLSEELRNASPPFQKQIYVSYKSVMSKADDPAVYYKVPAEDFIATKTYIQETEYLADIIARAQNGKYKIIDFDEEKGILHYKLASAKDNEVFEIDLQKQATLHPQDEGGEIWGKPAPHTPFVLDKKETSTNTENPLDRLLSAVHKNPTWASQVFSVSTWNQETKTRYPLMVQAGTQGYPIAGDFDAMHMIMDENLINLPGGYAFKIFNTTNKDEREKFCAYASSLRDELTSGDNASKPEFAVFQNLKVKENGEDPLEEYLNPNKTEKIKALGKLSVGSFLYNCALNKELGIDIFQHGEESFNPGTPESYGANVIFYKGEVYHINDERSYLAFLFHQYDHLTNHFLNIHPSVFRERKPPPDETDITEMWIDLMQFQVLIGNFGKNIEKIDEKLITEYNAAVDRFNKKNPNNPKYTFKEMQEFLESTKPGEGPGVSQKLGDKIRKIDEIYRRHERKTNVVLKTQKTNIKLFEELSKEKREGAEGNLMMRWLRKTWNDIMSLVKPTEKKPIEEPSKEKRVRMKQVLKKFQELEKSQKDSNEAVSIKITDKRVLFSQQRSHSGIPSFDELTSKQSQEKPKVRPPQQPEESTTVGPKPNKKRPGSP